MATPLSTFLLSAALGGLTSASHAQSLEFSPDAEPPLTLINANIIAHWNHVPIEVTAIKEMDIMRETKEQPAILQGLAPMGIIAMVYAGPVNSKAFTDISRELGLHGLVNFVLNGHPVSAEQAASLRIASQSIKQVRVVPAASESQLVTVTIELDTTEPKIDHPPGTIMVR